MFPTSVSQILQDDKDSEADDEVLTAGADPLSHIQPAILGQLSHLNLAGRARIDFIEGLRARANGTYSDVSRARLEYPNGRRVYVALKRLRFCYKEDIISLFEKEVYVWSKLNHPNVLSLLGFTFDESGYPLLVSRWMKQGSLEGLIREGKEYDLERLVLGIGQGLAYLHEQGVIHSDIKPGNVVVSGAGDARICDFGCARMITCSRNLGKMTNGSKGTTAYMAYELLICKPTDQVPYSKEADVWAFGMTVYELLARKLPYRYLLEVDICKAITSHQLPDCPADASDFGYFLWSICQACWSYEPKSRIQMSSIVTNLEQVHTQRDFEPILHSRPSLVEIPYTSISTYDPRARVKDVPDEFLCIMDFFKPLSASIPDVPLREEDHVLLCHDASYSFAVDQQNLFTLDAAAIVAHFGETDLGNPSVMIHAASDSMDAMPNNFPTHLHIPTAPTSQSGCINSLQGSFYHYAPDEYSMSDYQLPLDSLNEHFNFSSEERTDIQMRGLELPADGDQNWHGSPSLVPSLEIFHVST